MSPVLMISVLVGVVAAGIVWFGWNLAENLAASLGKKKDDSQKGDKG